jgi:hypothetical protein
MIIEEEEMRDYIIVPSSSSVNVLGTSEEFVTELREGLKMRRQHFVESILRREALRPKSILERLEHHSYLPCEYY